MLERLPLLVLQAQQAAHGRMLKYWQWRGGVDGRYFLFDDLGQLVARSVYAWSTVSVGKPSFLKFNHSHEVHQRSKNRAVAQVLQKLVQL